jgi:hypothetical protein
MTPTTMAIIKNGPKPKNSMPHPIAPPHPIMTLSSIATPPSKLRSAQP